MKASDLAIRIIETIAIKGDFHVHPTTKLSNLFYSDKPTNIDYLDLHQVMEMTYLSRSTIYSHMDQGLFPRPLKFGGRKIKWKAEHIHKWINDRKKTA